MAFSASFLSWLEQPTRDAVVIWKLTALTGGNPQTLWVASHARRTLSSDTPASTNIEARVISGPRFERGMAHPFSTTVSTGRDGAGSIVLDNSDGALDGWADYDWRDQVQVAYLGDRSWPVSDFEAVFTGWADYADEDENDLSIVLQPALGRFERLAQTERLSGIVNTALEGAPKPRLLGRAHFVEPAQIDHIDLRYQFGDDVTDALDRVFANGFELDPITGTTSPWDSTTDAGVTLTNSDQTAASNTVFWGNVHGAGEVDFDTETIPRYWEIVIDGLPGSGSGYLVSVGLGDGTVSTSSEGSLGESYVVSHYRYAGGKTFTRVNQRDGATVTDLWAGASLAVGDILSFLVEPTSRELTIWLNGDPLHSTNIAERETNDQWYPVAIFNGLGGEVTLVTDMDQFVYIPPSVLSEQVFGKPGEYVNSPGNIVTLIRNPSNAKISAHAASVSPATWETWSVPSAWTIDGTGLTISCSTGSRSGYFPAPRATDRHAVEIRCDSKGSATPAVELALEWPQSPDVFVTGQGRGRSGLSWYDDGAVWAGPGAGVNVGTASAWGGGNVLGLVVDKVADHVELYEDGVLRTTVYGHEIVPRTNQMRGPFSSSNYYREGSPSDGYSSSKVASGCLLVRLDSTFAGSNQILVDWGGKGIRIAINAAGEVVIAAFNSSSALIGVVKSSPLTVGRDTPVLWEIDTDEDIFRIYVDDVEDTTVVTEVSTGASIAWNTSSRDIGRLSAGGQAFANGVIGQIGVSNLWMGFDEKAVRRRFFDEDGLPVAGGSGGATAFGGTQPAIWCPTGDGVNNVGTTGIFSETGTVPEADGSAFRTAVVCPAVYSSSSSTDQFTVKLTDLTHDYSARPWGESSSAAEIIHALAGGDDDLEENFAASLAAPSLLGWTNAREDTERAILQRIEQSVGGGIFPTRDGLLRLAVLQAPEDQSSAGTIVATRHVEEGGTIRRTRDRGERLATVIAAWRVWSPHRAGEVAGAISGDLADLIQEDYGIKADALGALAAGYEHGRESPALETLISDGDPLDPAGPRSAAWLSRRVSDLYSAARHFYSFPFVGLPTLEVGDVWTLQVDRWGMSAGKKLFVLSVSDDLDGGGDVVLWG